MFVEITQRQSGKTTRLVENAINYLNSSPNTIINIVSTKIENSYEIREKLVKNYNIDSDRIVISHKMSIKKVTGSRIIRNYVDEFDFIDDDFLFIDDDAYYTTTINTYSDSVFRQKLLEYYRSYIRISKLKSFLEEI